MQNLKPSTLDWKSSSKWRCLYDSFHYDQNPPVFRNSATLYHIPHKNDERHSSGILSHFPEMKEKTVQDKQKWIHMLR